MNPVYPPIDLRARSATSGSDRPDSRVTRKRWKGGGAREVSVAALSFIRRSAPGAHDYRKYVCSRFGFNVYRVLPYSIDRLWK